MGSSEQQIEEQAFFDLAIFDGFHPEVALGIFAE